MRRRALILLTTMALALAVLSGTATAETANGLIYIHWGNGIAFVDPQITNPQPTVISEGSTFDISRDRTTLVYSKGYFGSGRTGPLYTLPLSNKPYSGAHGTEVNITNLWKCDNCESQRLEQPRFSPDGKTIYFRGVDVLSPDEDTAAIYSVPTEGGQATEIPIDWFYSDGTRVPVASFGLSHDGSKFALGGGSRGLFTVPVSGGVPTRVTTELCGGAAYPSFSPDDRMIVYTSLIREAPATCTGTGHWTIYTTPANNDATSPGTPLFPADATDTSQISRYWPTYSPDGRYIAFASWRDGSYYLATAPATGGPITNITPCSFCYPLWIEKKTADTTAPTVGSVSPTNAATGVSPTTNVEATFSEDMDQSTLTTSTFTLKEQGSTTPLEATVSYNSATKKATLDPSSNLVSNTTYTATIKGGLNGAKDLAGNALQQDYSWTFTTAIATPPETTITSGPSGTVNSTLATFEFSSSVSDSSFMCRVSGGVWGSGNWIPCQVPWNIGPSADASYTFEVYAIGPAGIPDPTPASQSWRVDATAPTVGSVSPTHQAAGVPLVANATATFSEDMDPGTLVSGSGTPGTFTLTKQGSASPLAATVSYDAANKKATLDPASDLEANTSYTARVTGGSSGAKDLAGNALAQDYSWTFTTAAPPAPSCTITGTANADTISGISGDDVICAGGGNDTIKGLGSNDTLKGEAGNDTLLGGVGNDTIDGGTGTDTASYSASLTAVVASLATNSSTGEGTDTFAGVENLLGSPQADTLTGSDANNTLTGGGGNDTEHGGLGNDSVVGGGGADSLFGDENDDAVNSKDSVKGNDSLDGGAGTDTKVTDRTEKSIVGFP